MTLKDQNPPPEMVIPDAVQIKPSEVDTKRNGEYRHHKVNFIIYTCK